MSWARAIRAICLGLFVSCMAHELWLQGGLVLWVAFQLSDVIAEERSK